MTRLTRFTLLISMVLISFSNLVNAQFGFSHELGAIVGPVAFQSDYGQRGDFRTNFGNTGYGVGIIHYLNFSYKAECNCYTPETYFNDHFKLRTEVSHNKTKLENFGRWVDRGGEFSEQLKAMHGSTTITNVGMQLEYFPYSIRDFSSNIGSLGPFISLGGQFSFYKPTAFSDLGPGLGQLPGPTPETYFGAFNTKGGTTFSVVSSVGTRYKLTLLSDLMIDLRFQYYFSNYIDGLSRDLPSNKANDWLVWLNVGYIYYL